MEEDASEEVVVCEVIDEEETAKENGKEAIPCPYEGCDKSFYSRWSLTRHVRTHTGEKPFVCNYPGCAKEFVQKCSLKRHRQTHAAAKQFTCPYCNKGFKLREYLDVHKRIHEKGGKNKGSAITLSAKDVNEAEKNARANADKNVVRYENATDTGAEGSMFHADSPLSVALNQLRQRLVRNSVRYHEDLYVKQEHINSLAQQNGQLKNHLQQCSLALLEAHRLLEQSGHKIPDFIRASVMEYSSYGIQS